MRGHLFLPKSTIEKIDALKTDFGANQRPGVIQGLITEHEERSKLEARLGLNLAVGTFDQILEDPTPASIVGLPYEGKSYTLDVFLRKAGEAKIPFLLFESNNEHSWIQNKLTFYEALRLNWIDHSESYIIYLEKDLDLRRMSVREMSKALLRLEGDVRLAPWIIAFEEAHDYSRIESFLTLLRRMRKSVRKLIVVSTEAELFKMCKPFRPIPKIDT